MPDNAKAKMSAKGRIMLCEALNIVLRMARTYLPGLHSKKKSVEIFLRKESFHAPIKKTN